MTEKRVLSVGVQKESLGTVTQHLEVGDYAVETTPTPRSALTVLGQVRFDLVIVAHPLEGLDLRAFLSQLRHASCESNTAKVLVLARSAAHEELQNLHQRGLEILSSDQAMVGDLASQVLTGDPRIPISVMVRLEAALPYGNSIRICQSENLSVSGMLVRTADTLPVDTPVVTHFSIPDGKDPIEARARVVRLTGPGEIPGIALQFLELADETQRRLAALLARE